MVQSPLRTPLIPILSILLLLLGGVVGARVSADTTTSTASSDSSSSVDAAQTQIDQQTAKIAALKDEIAALQKELDSTTGQKLTLQNAIKSLNLQISKLTKSISLTQSQINAKSQEITTISSDITETTKKAATSADQVASTIRSLNQSDRESEAASLLSSLSFSDWFIDEATLSTIRTDLILHIQDLNNYKSILQNSKLSAEQKRSQLAAYKATLAQQTVGLSAAKDSQNKLLTDTKSKESNYQTLIEEKKKQQAQFEQDLFDYQAKLGLVTDSTTLPPTGSQPLAWPLASIKVTQYFGNTDFATANAQLYNGHGHSGVDFAASVGTPVLAARGGIVIGVGDTDKACPNASYGKFVFIKHDDGLSTLYAHFSKISVAEGDRVTVGQTIGYSGSTGYATGPHLHFGVFATSGSQMASFASKGCPGKTYYMPVGDLSAYLNPLSYLPSLKK